MARASACGARRRRRPRAAAGAAGARAPPTTSCCEWRARRAGAGAGAGAPCRAHGRGGRAAAAAAGAAAPLRRCAAAPLLAPPPRPLPRRRPLPPPPARRLCNAPRPPCTQLQGLLPLEPLQLQAAQRHAAPADRDRRVRECDRRVPAGAGPPGGRRGARPLPRLRLRRRRLLLRWVQPRLQQRRAAGAPRGPAAAPLAAAPAAAGSRRPPARPTPCAHARRLSQVLHTLHVAETCRVGDKRNILQVGGGDSSWAPGVSGFFELPRSVPVAAAAAAAPPPLPRSTRRRRLAAAAAPLPPRSCPTTRGAPRSSSSRPAPTACPTSCASTTFLTASTGSTPQTWTAIATAMTTSTSSLVGLGAKYGAAAVEGGMRPVLHQPGPQPLRQRRPVPLPRGRAGGGVLGAKERRRRRRRQRRGGRRCAGCSARAPGSGAAAREDLARSRSHPRRLRRRPPRHPPRPSHPVRPGVPRPLPLHGGRGDHRRQERQPGAAQGRGSVEGESLLLWCRRVGGSRGRGGGRVCAAAAAAAAGFAHCSLPRLPSPLPASQSL
jgi:hypothetical protein